MKTKKYPRYLLLLILACVSFLLQSCKSTEKTTASPENIPTAQIVSFETDIYPILENSCTPCHFPEQGKKAMLNTYDAASRHAKEMLERVQLPPDNFKFMPFKSKNMPLSESEIVTLKNWIAQGMPE